MTPKDRAKAARIRFEKRHPGLVKKRNRKRYMEARGYNIQKEREDIKQEIIDTKKYIKEIWGKPTYLKEMGYKGIRRVGDELGINVFNVKSFNEKHRGFKKSTLTCKYCNKKYDMEIKIGVKYKSPGICPSCREKNYIKTGQDRKIKNKIRWERLVLNTLNKKQSLKVSEVAEKLGDSVPSVRKAFKFLEREGKIKVYIPAAAVKV